MNIWQKCVASVLACCAHGWLRGNTRNYIKCRKFAPGKRQKQTWCAVQTTRFWLPQSIRTGKHSYIHKHIYLRWLLWYVSAAGCHHCAVLYVSNMITLWMIQNCGQCALGVRVRTCTQKYALFCMRKLIVLIN